MKQHTFDIRVALLGHVSAGKSTVLNALLRDKFSEVAMRRTTAGVNLFRLHDGAQRVVPLVPSTHEGVDDESWRSEPEHVHDATFTLRQIVADNSVLRETNQIQETTFNVQVDEPLCEMRQDTKLVLIDIPGLNEADSKDIYRDYVFAQWHTFDCIVVVMDVSQGVNTNEQVKLLETIHDKVHQVKDIPIIVLCNKVDDPDNKEVMGFVQEISQKVRTIFQGGPSVTSLYFAPISAENAFVYRTASRLSLDAFKQLDESLIDKIVCEEIGKAQWRKLSVEQRYQTAYNVITNQANYGASLEATNFHAFLGAFRVCVGGDQVQLGLIQKQLAVGLQRLSLDQGMVAVELERLRTMAQRLGLPFPYNDYFWDVFKRSQGSFVDTFVADLDHGSLQVLMSQLIQYGKIVHISDPTNTEEHARVVNAMVSLVLFQVRHIVTQSDNSTWLTSSYCVTQPLYDWNSDSKRWDQVAPAPAPTAFGAQPSLFGAAAPAPVVSPPFHTPPINNPHHWKRTKDGWKNKYTAAVVEGPHNPVTGKPTWDTLSPLDYSTVAKSILLLIYNKSFNLHFGRERFMLEKIVGDYHALWQQLNSPLGKARQDHPMIHQVLVEFTMCKWNDWNESVPVHPDKYSLVAHIDMPRDISDPRHWGHLTWQFCEFTESTDATTRKRKAT